MEAHRARLALLVSRAPQPYAGTNTACSPISKPNGHRLPVEPGGMPEQCKAATSASRATRVPQLAGRPRITWRIGHSRAWRQPDLFRRNVDIRITDDKGRVGQRRQYPIRTCAPAHRRQQDRHSACSATAAARRTSACSASASTDMIVRSPVPAEWPIEGKLPEAISRSLGSTLVENHERPLATERHRIPAPLKPWRGTEFILSHSLIDRDVDGRASAATSPVQRQPEAGCSVAIGVALDAQRSAHGADRRRLQLRSRLRLHGAVLHHRWTGASRAA